MTGGICETHGEYFGRDCPDCKVSVPDAAVPTDKVVDVTWVGHKHNRIITPYTGILSCVGPEMEVVQLDFRNGLLMIPKKKENQ